MGTALALGVALGLAVTGCTATQTRPAPAGTAPGAGAVATPGPTLAPGPLADGSALEPSFVPSLAPRPGRPCGDVVGLSRSGPFTAAIIALGEDRSLVDATPQMEACVEANGLDIEFTIGG